MDAKTDMKMDIKTDWKPEATPKNDVPKKLIYDFLVRIYTAHKKNCNRTAENDPLTARSRLLDVTKINCSQVNKKRFVVDIQLEVEVEAKKQKTIDFKCIRVQDTDIDWFLEIYQQSFDNISSPTPPILLTKEIGDYDIEKWLASVYTTHQKKIETDDQSSLRLAQQLALSGENNEWSCFKCTLINKSSALIRCVGCNTPRKDVFHSAPSAPPPPESKKQNHQWNCSKCTYVNESSAAIRCVACNSLRKDVIRAHSPHDTNPLRTDNKKWSCSKCTFINQSSVLSRCAACGILRDDVWLNGGKSGTTPIADSDEEKYQTPPRKNNTELDDVKQNPSPPREGSAESTNNSATLKEMWCKKCNKNTKCRLPTLECSECKEYRDPNLLTPDVKNYIVHFCVQCQANTTTIWLYGAPIGGCTVCKSPRFEDLCRDDAPFKSSQVTTDTKEKDTNSPSPPGQQKISTFLILKEIWCKKCNRNTKCRFPAFECVKCLDYRDPSVLTPSVKDRIVHYCGRCQANTTSIFFLYSDEIPIGGCSVCKSRRSESFESLCRDDAPFKSPVKGKEDINPSPTTTTKKNFSWWCNTCENLNVNKDTDICPICNTKNADE